VPESLGSKNSFSPSAMASGLPETRLVGSRARGDHTGGFRTPPLLYIGSTAPYFHDGRYATLEQLLEDNLDRMGHTSHLGVRARHTVAPRSISA